jgi:hypothetical protein
LHVNEVAEVPTHEVIVPRDSAGSGVPRVVGAFGTDNALREAGSGELIHFFRDIEYIFGREGTPWKPEFAGHNDRMSLQEIKKEVAQLSAEERDALRRHLDQLDFFPMTK